MLTSLGKALVFVPLSFFPAGEEESDVGVDVEEASGVEMQDSN